MNIAILGAGTIVPDFLAAAERIPELNIYAIYGREKSLEKLQQFQNKYGIDRIYHDYGQLLSDEHVDAVYVALPNHLHFEFAKRALLAKKHVIVEKPFVCSYDEAKDLASCAKEHHVILFEAISTQYLPNYKKTKALLESLGRLHIVEVNFSQYSRRYDQFLNGIVLPVFDPAQAGGALMDLNVYNIHYVTGLFGEPGKVRYYANIQRDVDTSGVLVMCYPGFVCVCTASKDSYAPSHLAIQGENGCIKSDSCTNSYEAFSLCMRDGLTQQFAENGDMPRLYYELLEFSNMVQTLDEKRCARYLNHTLIVQKILDAARVRAGCIPAESVL